MRIKEDLKVAFPVSSVWFGALIGPSMVSGTYAAVYFAPYGAWGIILSYLSMAGICLIVGLSAAIVYRNQTYEYARFAKVIYGRLSRFLTPVMDIFMILAMVVGGSAVLSMSGTLLNDLLNMPALAGALAMAVMGILLDTKGAGLVRLSSSIMTPILIIGFLFMSGSGIISHLDGLKNVLTDWDISRPVLTEGIQGAVLLGFSNLGMVTSLCSVEQKVTRTSQCIWIAVCSFLLNGTAFALTTLFLLPYCPEVLFAEVPATYVIENYVAVNHPWIHHVYWLLMFFALLSSSAPQLHAVSARVLNLFPATENEKVQARRNLGIGILYMACCIAISTFGLYTIVSRGYSMLAGLGMPLIALPVAVYAIRSMIRPNRQS